MDEEDTPPAPTALGSNTAGIPQMPAPPAQSQAPWATTEQTIYGSASSGIRSHRRVRTSLVIAAAVLVGIAAIALHRGDGFPESIAGLPRIHSAQAREAEEVVASIRVGGVSYKVAWYGDGDIPTLVVERFEGIPDTYTNGSSDQFFDEMIRGFQAASYTTVDTDGKVTQTIDSIQYTCASIGPESASRATPTGALCLWSGADVGMVLTTRTTDPTAALGDVRAAFESVH